MARSSAKVKRHFDADGQEVFMIGRLLEREWCGSKRVWSYLVKWRDHDRCNATWEPATNLPQRFIRAYDSAHPR
jgi:hypothetical protein